MSTVDEQVVMALREKLDPHRFPDMSPKMAAIVGHIVGEQLGDAAIVEMTVTSDNFVLARVDDDPGFNEFIGAFSDLVANWTALLDVAGLTAAERHEAEMLFTTALGRSYKLQLATVNNDE